MIPSILHRIWIGGTMPKTFRRFGEQWRELHPRWEFKEWIPQDFPPLDNQDIFDRAQEITPDWKRFQADLLRLELIYAYGGVYVDTDTQPLKPIDRFLDNECFLVWSPNRGPKGKNLLTNGTIGAVPNHPFIRACIDAIPESVAKYPNQRIAVMVGPWHITRVFEKWQQDNVTTYPPDLFYPQSIADRDAGKPLDLTHAYTHHLWATTARKRGIRFD